MNSEEKRSIIFRVTFVYAMVIIICALIFHALWKIQVVDGDQLREQGRKIVYKKESVEAIRGNICDEDGNILVTSVVYYDLYFDALYHNDSVFTSHLQSLADKLQEIFPKAKNSYKTDLLNARKKNQRYMLLKRGVTLSQLTQLKKTPMFHKQWLNGGLIVKESLRRERIFGEMAQRTLGNIAYDNINNTNIYIGLEGSYDQYLRGEDGSRIMQKIAGGKYIPCSQGVNVSPQNGMDLITTLDVNIQDVAENSLRKQLQLHEAEFGCAIVMETQTGYIKALANIGRGNRERNGEMKYFENYNYAVAHRAEPGSTIKLASYLAAIDDGKITSLSEMIDVGNGSKVFSKRTIRDTRGYGNVTLRQAFEVSSNIAVADIVSRGYQNNPKEYIESLRRFHLLDKTGIDIAGEPDPLVSQPGMKTWSKISLPWLAFGYESEFTPLQLTTFYNGVANGGKIMKPQLVKEIRNAGDLVKKFDPQVLVEKMASQAAIDSVKSLLEGVVLNGTARNLKGAVYSIAGKTGTAQIAQKNKGYNKKDYRASFIGYFPAESPRYTIMVMIASPSKGSYYGNRVAGNVFREIGDKIFAKHVDIPPKINAEAKEIDLTPPKNIIGESKSLYNAYMQLGIDLPKPDQGEYIAMSVDHNNTVLLEKRDMEEGLVPNLVGMTLKDAMGVLNQSGLRVVVKGRGKVARQSIKSGQALKKGETIELQLL